MAKECINCGAEIKFYQDYFCLMNQGVYFCGTCAQKAKPLLQDIKIALSDASYQSAKKKFDEELPQSGLSDRAQKYLQYEFDDLAQSIPGVESKKLRNARVFNGSFQACCGAIYRAGKTITGSEPVVPMQCIKLPTRDGEYHVVTAVFENYFMRTGSYASLSITMVWVENLFKAGTAIVSAVASGGGEGLFNISWGAEEDFAASFWRALRDQNPSFEFREYGESFWDSGIEFQDLDRGSPASDAQTSAASDGPPRQSRQAAGRTNMSAGASDSGAQTIYPHRIGVLGGTFDPVHIGHVALGRAALMEAGLAKLIVMPAYIQPFKQGKRVTDDEHRLAMAKLAFAEVPRTEVSTFEIDRMRVSYTYDTMTALQKEMPGKEIFFITGTDAFLALDSWYKGIDLLEHFSFIVSIRPGYREEELDHKIGEYRARYGTNVIKLASQMPDISATEIREKYQAGEPATGLVPETVERYITEHELYQRD